KACIWYGLLNQKATVWRVMAVGFGGGGPTPHAARSSVAAAPVTSGRRPSSPLRISFLRRRALVISVRDQQPFEHPSGRSLGPARKGTAELGPQVVGDRGLHEARERGLVDGVTLVEIDRAGRLRVETGVEEPVRVGERGARE